MPSCDFPTKLTCSNGATIDLTVAFEGFVAPIIVNDLRLRLLEVEKTLAAIRRAKDELIRRRKNDTTTASDTEEPITRSAMNISPQPHAEHTIAHEAATQASEPIATTASMSSESTARSNGSSAGPSTDPFKSPASVTALGQPVVTLRALVTGLEAGAIIGQAGHRVNDLQMRFECAIGITCRSRLPATDRILSATGQLDNAYLDISGFILAHHRQDNALIATLVLRLLVSRSLGKAVMGPSATHVKRIRKETGARVEFADVPQLPAEEIVEITGTPQQIHAAVHEILRHILLYSRLAPSKLAKARHLDLSAGCERS